jgi:tetrapyrrole methylase family protein/MazG family protein
MKSFDKLVEIMARLRSDDGCPWDRAQDIENLKQYIIEEAYEVVDAIELANPDAIREELGDLALQIVFVARLAYEKGWFDINDVLDGINKKLIHRHPHVFGSTHLKTKEDVLKNWGRQKHNEKGVKIFDIPLQMPSLQATYRLIEKAKRLGVNPIKIDKSVYAKLNKLSGKHLEKQITSQLLSIVAIAQAHGINPEDLLRMANKNLIKKLKLKTG